MQKNCIGDKTYAFGCTGTLAVPGRDLLLWRSVRLLPGQGTGLGITKYIIPVNLQLVTLSLCV
jgi:hypothetical protein